MYLFSSFQIDIEYFLPRQSVFADFLHGQFRFQADNRLVQEDQIEDRSQDLARIRRLESQFNSLGDRGAQEALLREQHLRRLEDGRALVFVTTPCHSTS